MKRRHLTSVVLVVSACLSLMSSNVFAQPKTASKDDIQALRERIEKLEAAIANLKGTGTNIPANKQQQRVLTLLETPYLGRSSYSSKGARFFVARVMFVNLTPKPVVVKREEIELSFDGKPHKYAALPTNMGYQSFQFGSSSYTLRNIKPKAEVKLPAGGTGSTWVVFATLPSGTSVPKMLLNMTLAGKKTSLNVNEHALGLLDLKIERIGPRDSLGLLTVGGSINTINAGGLVDVVNEFVKKKVMRVVIRWTKSAPTMDSNTNSWLQQAANAAGRGSSTSTYGNFPTFPSEVREMHLAQIPSTSRSTTPSNSFRYPTTSSTALRVHKTDIDAVMMALKSAYEVLPRDELLREIEEGHPLTRAAALAGGGGRLSTDKLPLILKFADDKDPKLQQAALTALQHFGEKDAIAKLVGYVKKTKAPLANHAVMSLAASRYATAHQALIDILKNEPPKSRMQIVKVLAAFPRPIWSQTIYDFVKDTNSGVGVEALKALGVVGHPKLVDVLQDTLAKGDAALRTEAFRQLVTRTDTRSERIAMDYTLKLMQNSVPTSQMYALLRRTKDPRAIVLLLKHLDKASSNRTTIIDVLAQIGDQTVGDKLADHYPKLTSAYEKAAVLKALVRLKSSRFRELAGQAVMTRDSSLVRAACDGLRADASKEAVQLLANALDKSTYTTAWSYTSSALSQVATPAAKAALRRARDSSNTSKRNYGVNGLRTIMQRSPGYQYIYRAKQSSGQKKPKEAVGHYNLAIKLDAELSEAYSGRGHAYLKLKKNKEAKADFAKALKLDPYDALAITGLGVALSLEGNIDEAIKQIESNRSKFKSNNLYAYNSACVYGQALAYAKKHSKLADRDKKLSLYRNKALEELRNAVKYGYRNYKEMQADPDLASLKGLPEFVKIHSPNGTKKKPGSKPAPAVDSSKAESSEGDADAGEAIKEG